MRRWRIYINVPKINPIHPSMRGKQRTPYGMSPAQVGCDLHQTATQVALSIFTDCTNAGMPLQDVLLAIYLSGLHHGAEIEREKLK
jgi:hypothetical protein